MTDAVVVGLLAAIPATVTAAAAVWVSLKGNRKVDAIKVEIDGRLTQLLASVGAEQRAAGHNEGVEAERNR